jgi:hypothetical protein
MAETPVGFVHFVSSTVPFIFLGTPSAVLQANTGYNVVPQISLTANSTEMLDKEMEI